MQTIGGLNRPVLVVIGGHAGSGKTTLAHALAAELGLPVLSKNAIKDLLFTQLGTGDPAWSGRRGGERAALPGACVARCGSYDVNRATPK